MQRVEIKSKTQNKSMFTEIWIDGHKIEGVRSFNLRREVGNTVPILTLDLNAFNLSVDEEMLILQEGIGEIEINVK